MKIIQIKVKPNARAPRFEQTEDGGWIAHVNAPPMNGKANALLIAMVAEYFGVSKKHVSIKTGISGRLKRVEIDD